MGFSFKQEIRVRRQKLIMMTDLQTPTKQDPLTLAQRDSPSRTDQYVPTQTQIPVRSNSPSLSSLPTTQPSSSTNPTAWKSPPTDALQLLTLNVYQSGSPALNTVGLRFRRMSITCDGESFRFLSTKLFVNGIKGIGIRDGARGERKHTDGSISFIEHQFKRQVDLIERFSKSRYLEDLYKHQTRDKKGQCVDFHSEEFWKAEEETAAIDAPIPDDFQLMATISGRLSRRRLYQTVWRHLISEPRAVAPQLDCHPAIWKRHRGS
ncbi:hypothetical protein M9H77_16494 [Catharanthus roseus]|uniref:Uncharacterized protein n=1 Tax=Catharanthus roseus TaxID=4058 RepID=A0ACC0B1X6_CATRO|nr:hypothetical protein M9H77_16494 [Catharanthus roseus]